MPFAKENENDFGSQYGEYRYDAFGSEDPLEKYVVDRSEFFLSELGLGACADDVNASSSGREIRP